MQQQQRGAFRRFLVSAPGRALLIAATILVVFASFVYVEPLVAIPAFLLFGMAIPIWAGLKSPKYLALSGLVVILLVPPIATAAITQEVLNPLAPATSATGLPFSNGTEPVMQNALVSPYVGGTSTNFTWQVTVYPQYLPYANSTLQWLVLYVSSCPGATSNSSNNCAPGFAFWSFNDSAIGHATSPITQTFHFAIGSVGIWDWQMEIAYLNGTRVNGTGGNLTYQLLVGDSTYNGLEGPVVGNFGTVYAALLATIYVDALLYLALIFYLVLLIYLWYKSREQRKKDTARRAAGPPPEETAPGPPGSLPPGSGAATAAAPVATERSCPSCGAVVYANETTCWKCGASLSADAPGPLASGPKS